MCVSDSPANGAEGFDSECSGGDNFDDDKTPRNVEEVDEEEDRTFLLCLLHAGMDTEGEVFDDILVVNLQSAGDDI